MPYDLNDYENGGLIPDKTIATLLMRIKVGETPGADGILTRSKAGDSESLKSEFTLLDGPYAKQKVFANILLVGTTEGQRQMCDKNKGLLKSIIDSARNLDPKDKSDATRKLRTVELRDLDGLRFLAEIGIQPARTDKATGQSYDAQNVIEKVITKDQAGWRGPIEQMPIENGGPSGSTPPPSTPPANSTPPITKPSWAQ